MRELGIITASVIGFALLLWLLVKAFNTSASEPAHALELAHMRAEASAAKAEAERSNAELEKAKAELKKLSVANKGLKKRVVELETKLAAKTR